MGEVHVDGGLSNETGHESEPEPDFDKISAEIQAALNISEAEAEEWQGCDSHDTEPTQILTDEDIVEYTRGQDEIQDKEDVKSARNPSRRP